MRTGLVEKMGVGGGGVLEFLYSYKKNILVNGGEKRDIISMQTEHGFRSAARFLRNVNKITVFNIMSSV